MLNGNTALISSLGASRDGSGEIMGRALKEAANITTTHGYRYFIVLTADDTSSRTTVWLRGEKIPLPVARTRTLGNMPYPASTYMLPDRMITRFKPSLDIIIQMYKQGEIDPAMAGVWSADALRAGNVAVLPNE